MSKASQSDACIFCAKVNEQRDEENLILHRGQHNFVLLNLYPYTTGHLMVVPYAHIASLEDLPEETSAELMILTKESVRHLRAVYRPQGLNAGMNLGECAGAGVAGHLHMHVLPRWTGDANFMTTIGETRIMPEELPETWRRLSAAFRGE
ncbi:HIT domain-containing protein [uncultured Paludibaculum sp.]|uniref:HIT family protein n=1 Tax=uncultured Paludibaculum sp. TaxID=1765020 RepID=UPI002AAABD50|nr:HIT domain-containing protein [uncultured Paludibaculum sp.]